MDAAWPGSGPCFASMLPLPAGRIPAAGGAEGIRRRGKAGPPGHKRTLRRGGIKPGSCRNQEERVRPIPFTGPCGWRRATSPLLWASGWEDARGRRERACRPLSSCRWTGQAPRRCLTLLQKSPEKRPKHPPGARRGQPPLVREAVNAAQEGARLRSRGVPTVSRDCFALHSEVQGTLARLHRSR